jgi:DNA-binding XRE family transcriptional regulator
MDVIGSSKTSTDLTICQENATLAFMALEAGLLAENIRRLAGMHLVSLDALAEYVGISRQAMMNMVAHKYEKRSLPRTSTTLALANAFSVPLGALYQEPAECLRHAVENFESAPITSVAHVPVKMPLAHVPKTTRGSKVVNIKRKKR